MFCSARHFLGHAFALAALIAVTSASRPSFADPPHKTAQTTTKKAKSEHRWPMSSERFRAEIEARIGKTRARLEKTIEKRKINVAKSQAMRQEFLNAVAALRTKLGAVTADGTVTREEAQKVREMSRQLLTRHR